MVLLKSYARLSLKWKILIPFLVVSLAVSLTATLLLGRSLQNQVYARADEDVRHETSLASVYIEREKSYMVSQLTIMVEEGRWLTGEKGNLFTALSNVDMVSVMRMLGIGGSSLVKADFVKITAPDGRVLVDLSSDLFSSRVLNDADLVAVARAGTNAGDIVTTTDGQRVYLLAAAIVPSVGTAGGLIELGTKVDADLLSEIGLPERTLFTFTKQGIAASTDTSFYNKDWAGMLASGQTGIVSVAGQRFVLATAPVKVGNKPSGVSVATVMPIAPLAAEARNDWIWTWVIFGVGALVLILSGLLITQRIVNPVRQLTAAAERLKGGDFDGRLAVTRVDEIGELARAFNTMSYELKLRDQRLTETFNEVKRLSETDSLTGLLNHRMITERLSHEVARAHRYGIRFGLIVIDLDNFKLLNDTYGHPLGDEALRRIARLLEDNTRAADYIGRNGGDEFMLVLPEAGPPEVIGVAQKLQSALSRCALDAPDDCLVPLTMSLGLACYPEDGHDVNMLMALADANLYLSKARGGNTVTGGQIEPSADETTSFGMLGSLVTLVDNKDRYTRHHSEEVTQFAIALARQLGLSDESQRMLRIAGLLHDVGKIGVPDRILRKPGRVTEDEFEIIKQHAVLGDAIVAAIPDLAEIRAAIVAHHERYDGGGYPNELRGEKIPLLGRILAVADAYSAMVSDRPYRKALSCEAAEAELIAGSGTQFDPVCVKAFLTVLHAEGRALAASTMPV